MRFAWPADETVGVWGAGWSVPGRLAFDDGARGWENPAVVYGEVVAARHVAESGVALLPVDSDDLWEPRRRKGRRGRHVAEAADELAS